MGLQKLACKLFIFISLISYFNRPLLAQTNWTKYANNPVLQRDTVIASLPNDLIVISDCWVIKEGSTYKMWYTGGGINYPPDTLLRSRICYATSTDGITWDKYVGNPVLDVSYNGSWDSLGVETVSILIDSSAPSTERYKMWYAGQYFNSYRYDIGYAYSSDGINWVKHANPVLQVGSNVEWDNGFLEGPSVIKDGSTYKMWYCGYDAIPDGSGTDGKANIGYAISNDGINWVKYAGNPIIVSGINTWDSIYVQDPHVIKEGNEYHMWYGGGDNDTYYSQQVGYATSQDGINWIKSPLNPILTRGNTGDWDEILASFPSVLNDSGNYKMWYTGRNLDPLPVGSLDYYWEIGYAIIDPVYIKNLNPKEDTDFSFYPNPVHDVIRLNIHLKESIEVYVTNIVGEMLINVQNQRYIDVSQLPSGIYYLTLTQNQQKCTKKFIKN
jgi:predicted GH43/DUF377 family glycosyl hydrolase